MKLVSVETLLHSATEDEKAKMVEARAALESFAQECTKIREELEKKRASTSAFRDSVQSLLEQDEVLADTKVYLLVSDRVSFLSKEANTALKIALASGSKVSEKDLKLALSPFFGLTQIRDEILPLRCYNLIELVNRQILSVSDPLSDMMKEFFKSKLEGRPVLVCVFTIQLFPGPNL